MDISLHITIYLVVALLFSNLSSAATLEGDWLLEDVTEAAVKNAFSIAQSSSQKNTNATLGIRKTVKTPLELYLVVSTKSAVLTCQYDVIQAEFGTVTVPLTGSPQATEISNIKPIIEDHNQLWIPFKRGEVVTIKVKEQCDSNSESQERWLSFSFSLSGSSAALEFVAPGLIPKNKVTVPEITTRQKKNAQKPQVTSEQPNRVPHRSNENNNSSNQFFLLFLFALAVTLVVWLRARKRNRKLRESTVQVEPSIVIDDFLASQIEKKPPLSAEAPEQPRDKRKIVIEGQLETLKKLRKSLSENGISRFSPITEINSFMHGYDIEVGLIPGITRSTFEYQYQKLSSEANQLKQQYESLTTSVKEELDQEIQHLDSQITLLEKQIGNSFFKRLLSLNKRSQLKRKKAYLEVNSDRVIKRRTSHINQQLNLKNHNLEELTHNRERIINDRCRKSVKELSRIKDVIKGLYPVIAGAIGETSVLKTLSCLSNDFYLINDFSMKFDPPIYNRKEDDRIYSVQIDHLLISKAGVFILETKNWSEKSIQNIDLRSPVKQVSRTSHALFVLLNGDSGFTDHGLDHHHWGEKKIPVRSVIVMTNAKPTLEFKYVKIVHVNQLVGYIRYFEYVLSSSEVNDLFIFLSKQNNLSITEGTWN